MFAKKIARKTINKIRTGNCNVLEKVKKFFSGESLLAKAIIIIAALATILSVGIKPFQSGSKTHSSTTYTNEQYNQKSFDLVSIDLNLFVNGLENVDVSDPVKTPSSFIKEAQETAFLYFDQGDYSGALKYLKNTYDEQLTTYGIESFSTISTKYLIGLAYLKLFEYGEAIENFNTAIAAISDKTENKDELQADIYYALASAYYSSDGFENALQYYRKALDIKLELNESYDRKLFIYYRLIAVTYLRLGDTYNAMQTVIEANQIAQSVPENDIIIAGLNSIAGRVNQYQGNYGKAIENYEEALEIFEKDPERYQDLISSIKNNLGSVFMLRTEYDTALQYFLEALDIVEKMDEDSFYSRASVYSNIAIAYTDLKNYDIAKIYFEKVIGMTQSTIGNNNLLLASIYCNYACYYKVQSLYDKAFEYIQADLHICEKLLGTFNLDTAESYGSLGELYFLTNQPKKALFYYKKDLKIKESILGYDHPETCWEYYHIAAIIHNYGGDKEEVLGYLKKAYQKKAVTESTVLAQEVYKRSLETYLALGLDIKNFETWLQSDW
jgi:tetratricopeptide (TPR) repeat protein